jgi:Ca2+-binding RTX toxin-like protein
MRNENWTWSGSSEEGAGWRTAADGLQRASTAQVDTIPADPTTTAVIDPSSTVSSIQSGYVNTPGDADWYRMNVVAGTRYTIILNGYSSSAGGPALPSPTVRVFDAAGQLIGSDVSLNGTSAAYQLTATTTGVVYVSAEGTNGTTGRYGTMVIATEAPLPDAVPGDVTTIASIALGGSVTGRIETAGDKDWFRINLTAGTVYDFSLSALSGAAFDTLLQVRDASGSLVVQNDDSGFGTDSRLTFAPTTSGVYYLSAGGWESSTGQYRLSASLGTAGDIRTTIDWGTRLPGGVVEVYFIPAGQTHEGVASAGWNDYEIGRAMAALATYAAVVNLTFVRVDNASQAEFRLMTTTGLEEGEFGYFNPPGDMNAGLGVFQRTAAGWDEAGGGGLEAGGLGFVTLVHELGHGLGLAHPHDIGGTSTVMIGVGEADDSLGWFDLNQGVFTTLSYNDGWRTGAQGRPPLDTYGLQAGPMALDIAVLQAKYGANTGHRTGDDVYVLPGVNGAGAGYLAIWDAGGADTIEHRGSAAAVIDLRAATVDYSATGGGVLSHVLGVHGGFTIAQGVVIENAKGGSGDDTLRGNAAANTLSGGAGRDTIEGGAGGDRLFGEDGEDLVSGQEGEDFIDGGAGSDSLFGGPGRDHIIGGSENDRLFGQAGDDLMGGQDGDDFVDGGAGADTLFGDGGRDHILGGTENDGLHGQDGDDLIGGQDGDDFIDGGAGRDELYGDAGADHMVGGADNDRLFGQDGDDLIGGQDGDDFVDGGAGRDRLFGDAGHDHMVGGADADFIDGQGGDDLIGGQDGHDWIVGGAGRDRLYGDAGDDLIGGQDGDDFIDGGSGADTLFGDAGRDHMVGGQGDDRIDGGAGFDTAVFTGLRSGYTVVTGEGFVTVIGPDGTDTLWGVERLEFADSLVNAAPMPDGWVQ